MKSFNNYIRRALQAIFLVFLLFLPSCRYLKQKFRIGEYSLKSDVELAKKDSTRIADSLKRVMVENPVIKKTLPDSVKKVISAKKIFERTLTDSLLSIEGENSPVGSHISRYYIITGSFASHDNALQAERKYSSQGFKTAIINSSGKDGARLELVSVKTFSDYNEAEAFLKGFKGIYDQGAWIYTRK